MPTTLTKNDEQILETLKRDRLAEAHARSVGEKHFYDCGAYLASRPRTVIFGKGQVASAACSRLHIALLVRLLRHNGIKVLGFGVHDSSWAMQVASWDTEMLTRAALYCWYRANGHDHRFANRLVDELQLDVPPDFEP